MEKCRIGLMDKKLQQFIGYLTELSEKKFFYFARNFLPNTKTPYNKQLVAENLASFFINDEKREKLLSTLDPLDCLILALLQLRPSATLEDLLKMMEPFETVQFDEEKTDFHSYDILGGVSYPDFIAHLTSLARRLILLYKDAKLYENPLLSEDLHKAATLSPLNDYFLALKGAKDDGNKDLGVGFLNREFVKAFLSKQGHNLNPHAFPQLTIIQLNAFQTLLDSYKREKGSLKKLLLVESDLQLIAQILSKEEKEDNFYQEVLELFKQNEQLDYRMARYLVGQLAMCHDVVIHSDELLNRLEILGIIKRNERFLLTNVFFMNEEEENNFPLLVDSDLSISYTGKRKGDDLLWTFSHIERLDLRTIYKVDKKDIVRAFDDGYTVDTLVSYLKENTNQENLGFLLDFLNFTKEEYNQISLIDGIVVQGSPRVSNIIANHPALQQYIIAKLTPSIFIMERETRETWTAILKTGGILVPQQKKANKNTSLEMMDSPHTGNTSTVKSRICPINRPTTRENFNPNPLRTKIELSGYRKLEKDDLLKRLREKMIVDESQIGPNILEGNPSASGFAYRSKINICQMAIKDSSALLFINYKGKNMIVVAKKVLDRGKDNATLVCQKLPGYKDVNLDITKIFKIELTQTMIG